MQGFYFHAKLFGLVPPSAASTPSDGPQFPKMPKFNDKTKPHASSSYPNCNHTTLQMRLYLSGGIELGIVIAQRHVFHFQRGLHHKTRHRQHSHFRTSCLIQMSSSVGGRLLLAQTNKQTTTKPQGHTQLTSGAEAHSLKLYLAHHYKFFPHLDTVMSISTLLTLTVAGFLLILGGGGEPGGWYKCVLVSRSVSLSPMPCKLESALKTWCNNGFDGDSSSCHCS